MKLLFTNISCESYLVESHENIAFYVQGSNHLLLNIRIPRMKTQENIIWLHFKILTPHVFKYFQILHAMVWI